MTHYLALNGFGTSERLRFFVKALGRVTKVRVSVFSFVGMSQWEGLVFVEACGDIESMLDDFCECFGGSIGVNSIDVYMNSSMLICLKRILNSSKMTYGNWFCNKNLRYRENFKFRLEDMARKELRQRVVQETGMVFSERNMISLAISSRNAQVELVQSRLQMRDVNNRLRSLENRVADMNSVNTAETDGNVVSVMVMSQLSSIRNVLEMHDPVAMRVGGEVVDLTVDASGAWTPPFQNTQTS